MIDTSKLYEDVNLTMPLEQRRFFRYLRETLEELKALCGKKFVFDEGGDLSEPSYQLTDAICVLPLYHGAIVENILFLAGAGEEHKSEFMRKAHHAHLVYWNEDAKGRQIRFRRW